MVDEIWSEANPNTYFPRLRGYIAQGTGRALNVTQTKYLQNVAYIRLKNIQVGYNLPKRWISTIKATQAKLYISADNIWTYSPMYKITHNLDVENIQGSDRVLTSGTNGDGNNYPYVERMGHRFKHRILIDHFIYTRAGDEDDKFHYNKRDNENFIMHRPICSHKK